MLVRLRTVLPITKCFRDGTCRADPQPEFTSGYRDSFLGKSEHRPHGRHGAAKCSRKRWTWTCPSLPAPWLCRSLGALRSVKRDLRVTLEITDVTDAVSDVAFKVFTAPASTAGKWLHCACPAAHPVPREIDGYRVRDDLRARGWPTSWSTTRQVNEKAAVAHRQVPARAALKTIVERTGAQSGDLIFFGADKTRWCGCAGCGCAQDRHVKGYVNGAAWCPLWVVDFPMFEYDDEGSAGKA